jgi:hypothetical protein
VLHTDPSIWRVPFCSSLIGNVKSLQAAAGRRTGVQLGAGNSP